MANIPSRNTKPEILVGKYLFSLGFRYRKNVKKLPGKPDFALSKYKVVIFVNGCFWHGHEGCKYFVMAKSNIAFWEAKINYNRNRDNENIFTLTQLGWKVIVIWECELRHGDKEKRLQKLVDEIKSVI